MSQRNGSYGGQGEVDRDTTQSGHFIVFVVSASHGKRGPKPRPVEPAKVVAIVKFAHRHPQ